MKLAHVLIIGCVYLSQNLRFRGISVELFFEMQDYIIDNSIFISVLT